MPSRRVYCETLPYAELVRPRVLDLLARYRLELVLAVRPWDVAGIPAVARILRDRGIPLSIWPMLDDAQGRWASVQNARAFGELALATCDALEALALPPRDVLLDLEPPIATARSLVPRENGRREQGRSAPGRLARVAESLASARGDAFTVASSVLARTVADVHARGVATSTAVWPLVALDARGDARWQSLLGTPVDALGTRHVSVMMYTSILEGWSRGALRRPDATALLAAAAARSVSRWGSEAGVSLGCVGAGALENEPVYREPSELAEDVAVARAAGCDALALFDLGGVLARAPAEAWLDAFTAEDAVAAPRATKRVHVARALARAATWALGRR